ncbi:small glutamine-rich tetratricopeptide repeat-containing protein beta-like [Ciona intestinalis]
MASNSDIKRFVASIVQFLEDELNRDGVTPEMAESIDVARQCLHMAYTTTPEDVPSSQNKLLNVFLEACPPPAKPKAVSEEDQAKAEQLKQEGNEMMKKEKFDDAIDLYTKAIEIDSQNAVYYCNRAAAQTGRQKYDMSLTDCKRSLEIDPKYSKAFSRMGLTYSKMEMYDEAIKSYKKALELDPENEGYKKNLKIAEDKLSSQNAMAAPPSMAGLGGLGGMGGMGGMADMMNNPMFMNMAQKVMQDPNMQKMAMNMMSGMMGGGGNDGDVAVEGAAAAQPPTNFNEILQMGQQFAQQISQNNPEAVEELRKQMQGGDGENKDNPPTT